MKGEAPMRTRRSSNEADTCLDGRSSENYTPTHVQAVQSLERLGLRVLQPVTLVAEKKTNLATSQVGGQRAQSLVRDNHNRLGNIATTGSYPSRDLL